MSLYKIVFYSSFTIFMISWGVSVIGKLLLGMELIIPRIIMLISALLCLIAYSIKWRPWKSWRKKREPKGPGGIIY